MSASLLQLSAPPCLRIEAGDSAGAIRATLEALRGHGAIADFAGFGEEVFQRQRINPPVLDIGVAIPHARTSLVRDLVFAAGRCARSLSFSEGHPPVRLVFLFGVPPHRISEYLAVMAALVRRLRSEETLRGLLTAETAEEFQQWLTD